MEYLWPEASLDDEKKARLKRAGIVFAAHSDTTWFRRVSSHGYLFAEKAHTAALKLLGASSHPTSKSERNPKSVEIVFDRPIQYGVYVELWCHDVLDSQAFREIAQRLLIPALKCDIVLRDTKGEAEPGDAGDEFVLHLWSSPNPEAVPCRTTPNALWEIPVLEPGLMFKPSEKGTTIFDSADVPIGEFVATHGYLFVELTEASDACSLKLFECFCQALLNSMCEGGLNPIAIRDSVYQDRREAYAHVCQGEISHELEISSDRLEVVDRELRSTRAQLMRLLQEERCLREKIPLLAEHRDGALSRFRTEYDTLCANPKIVTAFVSDDILIVQTRVLFWRHPMTLDYYEIGAMRIELSLHPDSECILRIFNLTRQVKGAKEDMHHPHISNSGEPCWGKGNAEQTFITLLGRTELSAAVSLAIQFIETVNYHESWGKYFAAWPKVPKAEISDLRDLGLIPAQNVREESNGNT